VFLYGKKKKKISEGDSRENEQKKVILGTRKVPEKNLKSVIRASPKIKEQKKLDSDEVLEIDLSISVPGTSYHKSTINNTCRTLFGEIDEILDNIKAELKD